jgi:hypothetical protein
LRAARRWPIETGQTQSYPRTCLCHHPTKLSRCRSRSSTIISRVQVNEVAPYESAGRGLKQRGAAKSQSIITSPLPSRRGADGGVFLPTAIDA